MPLGPDGLHEIQVGWFPHPADPGIIGRVKFSASIGFAMPRSTTTAVTKSKATRKLSAPQLRTPRFGSICVPAMHAGLIPNALVPWALLPCHRS